MIDTADLVAERYGIPRARLDEYAFRSQQRTAAAQASGLYDEEIVPMETVMVVKDKETGEASKVCPPVWSWESSAGNHCTRICPSASVPGMAPAPAHAPAPEGILLHEARAGHPACR